MFTTICLPIVVRGAPLADDFFNCLRPQQIGLGAFLAESLERLGALRRAHFIEILITTETCHHLPFGVAIAVPLVITLAIAVLLRGLLRDLGVPEPCPSVGGALWLLQPLGTEAALWPAATHVGLGLVLALIAIRLHRAGHHGWGAAAVAAAGLSVEQVVLAMPIAVWATTAGRRRQAAVVATLVITALLLAAFLLWPGDDPRLRADLGTRIAGVLDDPVDRWSAAPALLAGVALIAAVNMPVVLSVPHQGSPRIFTPSWLVLSGVLAYAGPAIRRPMIVRATTLAGVFAAGAR